MTKASATPERDADPTVKRPVLDWAGVLVPRLGQLARAYLPGASLDARHREHLLVEVARALECSSLEHAHQGWYGLLGPAELTEHDDDLVAWATSVVLVGPGAIDEAAPTEVTDQQAGLVRAVVAHAAAAAATVHAVGVVADRLRGRSGPRRPPSSSQLASAAAAGVLALPTTIAGSAFGALGRILPAAPTVAVEAEPNLMAQLLAEVLPTWLGSPFGRTFVAALPVSVPLAVSTGASGATVWVGRGRVTILNGVDDTAWATFDGEVDSLVRAASQNLNRELRADRLAH